jgi:hypothetical protein
MWAVSVRRQLPRDFINDLPHFDQGMESVLSAAEMTISRNDVNATSQTLDLRRGNNRLLLTWQVIG